MDMPYISSNLTLSVKGNEFKDSQCSVKKDTFFHDCTWICSPQDESSMLSWAKIVQSPSEHKGVLYLPDRIQIKR